MEIDFVWVVWLVSSRSGTKCGVSVFGTESRAKQWVKYNPHQTPGYKYHISKEEVQ